MLGINRDCLVGCERWEIDALVATIEAQDDAVVPKAFLGGRLAGSVYQELRGIGLILRAVPQ
jgi:hypothetical protein